MHFVYQCSDTYRTWPIGIQHLEYNNNLYIAQCLRYLCNNSYSVGKEISFTFKWRVDFHTRMLSGYAIDDHYRKKQTLIDLRI